MGMLAGILGGLAGDQQHSAVANALLQHIAGNQGGGGGLGSLLHGFNQAGMGDKVDSWGSNAPNQPLSPEEVQQGMGQGVIEQLAARAGVSPTVAKVALAAVLPMIVNHLTPNGQVPQGGGLQQMLGGLLGRTA